MPTAEDVEAAKAEKEPLVPKKEASYLGHVKAMASNAAGGFLDSETERVMEYQTWGLGTWQTFFYTAGTIWMNKLLWVMVGKLLLVSIAVGILVFFLVVDPTAIDSAKFKQVSNLLKVFVGFLLGFFLSSSVKRWGDAVGGFLTLCNAIKSLMIMMHALGVPEDRVQILDRYCILSAEFLVLEMRLRTDTDAKSKEVNGLMEEFVKTGRLTEPEKKTLEAVEDHAALMWVWIVSLLSRASQDALVPNMASPTYGRLVMLANNAEEGIRQVVVASKVQLPFVYVHMLALLVHINNLLCAIGFGCTLGASMASILGHFGIYLWGRHMVSEDHGTVGADLQSIMMAFITSFVVPLMYQAFLQIGLLLAQPFDNPSSTISAVPAGRLIDSLRRELEEFKVMANAVEFNGAADGWKKPCYAETPQAALQRPK